MSLQRQQLNEMMPARSGENNLNRLVSLLKHIHVALHQMAGVGGDFTSRFGIAESALDLFG